MTLMALKAAADVNQEATNLNLVVKAITDVKKSVKATDVKPLKSTFTKSVDWPNFRTIKMVQLFASYQGPWKGGPNYLDVYKVHS